MLGAALLAVSGTAWAAPLLDDVLGPAAVAPAPGRLVPMIPLPPLAERPEPADLMQHPALLARYLEAQGGRLGDQHADPALVLTLAQILLRGDETFAAERMLGDGVGRWPERADLRRAWGRVLISLGRAEAARAALEPAVAASPGDPALRYLLGRALLSIEPRSAAHDVAAAEALSAALEIDPAYSDPDGVGAPEISSVIKELKGRHAQP